MAVTMFFAPPPSSSFSGRRDHQECTGLPYFPQILPHIYCHVEAAGFSAQSQSQSNRHAKSPSLTSTTPSSNHARAWFLSSKYTRPLPPRASLHARLTSPVSLSPSTPNWATPAPLGPSSRASAAEPRGRSCGTP